MKKTIAIATALVVASVAQSNATETARELWDNVGSATAPGSLQGATNGTTTFGFGSNAKWGVNTAYEAATNVLTLQDYDILSWQIGVYTMLPASDTTPETLALPPDNTNGWNSGSWATKLMSSSAWITFSSVKTNYFSAQLLKRGVTWYPVDGTNGYGPDDAALGLGFASGTTASSYFVGAGFTRTVAANGGGGYTNGSGQDIGDSDYVSVGTLGQAGYASHPTDSGGPYYVSAAGPPQEVEGYITGYPSIADTYVNGGLLIGRIITNPTGDSEVDVLTLVAGAAIPTADNETEIPSWDATYLFTNTATLDYLLVWMYGEDNANPVDIDGIRVATTLQEAVGEEIIGPPTITTIGPPPVVTNTVYAGTPVVLSVFANIDSQDATIDPEYQWLGNGVPIAGASGPGNVNYVYTNFDPTLAGPTNFSVVFSNYYGLSITSQVATLTLLPAGPPVITEQPVAALTRYVNAPGFSLGVAAVGTPPFTYQWSQITNGVTNSLSGQTNQILSLTDIQATNGGNYFCSIGNSYGSTNSASALVSVIVPTGYAAAVVANNPYAYWTLGETTNGNIVTNVIITSIANGSASAPPITDGVSLSDFVWLHDDWGGNDGAVLDPTNVALGQPGLVAPGFPAVHNAMFVPQNGAYARVNMPTLTNIEPVMTFVCWIYVPGAPNDDAFIMNRDYNNNGGFGIANGPEFVADTNGNPNMLGYQWGGGDVDPAAPFDGYTWTNSGLYVPPTTWTFVALVLSNTQATMYMGTNDAPLTVATANLPSNVDLTFPGTSYTNVFPLMLGRSGWPWAEYPTAGNTNSYDYVNITMSDVAVFTNALTPTNVYKLYLAAEGELITTTNSAGNVILSWPEGTLQSATNVNGPYTAIGGSPTSPYTVPNPKGARQFYRVKE